MGSVYLINVGANTSHQTKARSPIFGDGSFVYVSFPTKRSHRPGYADEALPFVRGVAREFTHADPCWNDFSYGDNCSNPRAGALKKVVCGDILLFWGLLWENRGREWSTFSGECGWYLLGALRVDEIAVPRQPLVEVSEKNRERAGRNPHFVAGALEKNDRVFIGDPRYSRFFERAVDLGVADPVGLMYTAFTAADGSLSAHGQGPSWRSSLRSCRRMWRLSDASARARVTVVRDAIQARTGFDLLEDL